MPAFSFLNGLDGSGSVLVPQAFLAAEQSMFGPPQRWTVQRSDGLECWHPFSFGARLLAFALGPVLLLVPVYRGLDVARRLHAAFAYADNLRPAASGERQTNGALSREYRQLRRAGICTAQRRWFGLGDYLKGGLFGASGSHANAFSNAEHAFCALSGSPIRRSERRLDFGSCFRTRQRLSIFLIMAIRCLAFSCLPRTCFPYASQAGGRKRISNLLLRHPSA